METKSRMKNAVHVILFLIVAAGMTGCASTGRYFVDRGRDAADVFTLTVGTGLGAGVRAGPAHIGLLLHQDRIGLMGGRINGEWDDRFGRFDGTQ